MINPLQTIHMTLFFSFLLNVCCPAHSISQHITISPNDKCFIYFICKIIWRRFSQCLCDWQKRIRKKLWKFSCVFLSFWLGCFWLVIKKNRKLFQKSIKLLQFEREFWCMKQCSWRQFPFPDVVVDFVRYISVLVMWIVCTNESIH